jgi:hypothetical protein
MGWLRVNYGLENYGLPFFFPGRATDMIPLERTRVTQFV